MILLGVDPGLDGALAIYDTELRGITMVMSMPVLNVTKGTGSKREINDAALIAWFNGFDDFVIDYAFVERVQSSPQMGVTSAFNFGVGYGGLKMLIAFFRWPVEYVAPNKWKKALSVPAEKDDALRRASQLMPRDTAFWTPKRNEFNKQQAIGRAEAALLCTYGEMWLGERGLLRNTPRARRKLSEVL